MGNKSKVDESKAFIQKMTRELQKVTDEDFSHEELRQAFVDFATFMFECQLGILDVWAEEKAEFQETIVGIFKQRNKQLDKEFRAVKKLFHEQEHVAARAEAAAMIAMMSCLGARNFLVTKGIMAPTKSVIDLTGYIPKKEMNFMRKVFKWKVKDFNELLDKAVEAARAAA